MSLKTVAEEYFSTLNPIASRIYTDMNETKAAYEELWNKIPEDERNQLLNESIIKPEVVIKYGRGESPKNEEYASKIIVEDHGSYRDEHSGPFSFRTRSQRDLSIFHSNNMNHNNNNRNEVTKPKTMPIIYRDIKFTESNFDDIITIEKTANINNTLPKTGLDFLDNW